MNSVRPWTNPRTIASRRDNSASPKPHGSRRAPCSARLRTAPLLRDARYEVEDQVSQPLVVLGSPPENLLVIHRLGLAHDADVVVGDQRDVDVADLELAGEVRLGYWVMLMTSQPASWNHLDSARVEKRGPWTVTTVPPLVGLHSLLRGPPRWRAGGTRGSRGRRTRCESSGGRRRRCPSARGAIDELIADDEVPGLTSFLRDPAAQGPMMRVTPAPSSPTVGPVVDHVRGQACARVPWRGKKAAVRPPMVPTDKGAEGSP